MKTILYSSANPEGSGERINLDKQPENNPVEKTRKLK